MVPGELLRPQQRVEVARPSILERIPPILKMSHVATDANQQITTTHQPHAQRCLRNATPLPRLQYPHRRGGKPSPLHILRRR